MVNRVNLFPYFSEISGMGSSSRDSCKKKRKKKIVKYLSRFFPIQAPPFNFPSFNLSCCSHVFKIKKGWKKPSRHHFALSHTSRAQKEERKIKITTKCPPPNCSAQVGTIVLSGDVLLLLLLFFFPTAQGLLSPASKLPKKRKRKDAGICGVCVCVCGGHDDSKTDSHCPKIASEKK